MIADVANPVLVARGLHRFYHIGDDETAALRDIGFILGACEFVAIMGPSGSGKSTLISCLTGLDEPDAGFVEIKGRRMTRRPEPERAALRAGFFGILLQSGNLFPHLTVTQNIALQLKIARRKCTADRLERIMDAVSMRDRAHAYPGHLSGGEAARAGLAVALAVDPPILVADEPTAEVDPNTEERIISIFETRRSEGRATIIATHSPVLAERSDRTIHLEDGRIADDRPARRSP